MKLSPVHLCLLGTVLAYPAPAPTNTTTAVAAAPTHDSAAEVALPQDQDEDSSEHDQESINLLTKRSPQWYGAGGYGGYGNSWPYGNYYGNGYGYGVGGYGVWARNGPSGANEADGGVETTQNIKHKRDLPNGDSEQDAPEVEAHDKDSTEEGPDAMAPTHVPAVMMATPTPVPAPIPGGGNENTPVEVEHDNQPETAPHDGAVETTTGGAGDEGAARLRRRDKDDNEELITRSTIEDRTISSQSK